MLICSMHNIYTVKPVGDVTRSGKEAINFKKPKLYILVVVFPPPPQQCANQHNCIQKLK